MTQSVDADHYALKFAEKYCANNPAFKYTGHWKNVKQVEGTDEISWFQVVRVKPVEVKEGNESSVVETLQTDQSMMQS